MGVMIPSDPWLTYRSAQLPLFRMIFPWVLAHMGVGSTSCLHSFLGTKYRPNRPNGDPIGGHFSFLHPAFFSEKVYVPKKCMCFFFPLSLAMILGIAGALRRSRGR